MMNISLSRNSANLLNTANLPTNFNASMIAHPDIQIISNKQILLVFSPGVNYGLKIAPTSVDSK